MAFIFTHNIIIITGIHVTFCASEPLRIHYAAELADYDYGHVGIIKVAEYRIH